MFMARRKSMFQTFYNTHYNSMQNLSLSKQWQEEAIALVLLIKLVLYTFIMHGVGNIAHEK